MKTKSVWMFAVLWVAVLLVVMSVDSCATTPVVPTPSAGDYLLACQNLASLGCPVGTDPQCAATLQEEDVGHLTNIDVACLKTAATKTAAVSCGGVSCQ